MNVFGTVRPSRVVNTLLLLLFVDDEKEEEEWRRVVGDVLRR